MAKFAIVGLYLGINALIFIWLSFKVIGIRRGEKISIGDGENETLAYYVRGHGNAAEYMPIFFLLMIAAASLNTPPIALHLFGVLFTMGRLLHALWFVNPSFERIKQRIAGMLLTLSSIALLAIGLIIHATVIMAGGY